MAGDRIVRRHSWLALALALTGCTEPSPRERDASLLSVVAISAPRMAAPPHRVTAVAPIPARSGHPDLPLDPVRPLPAVLRGVTTDTAWNVPELTAAIRAHQVAPTVRIVLDPQPKPEAYRPAITALRPHAYLMGLLIDSGAMRRFTPAQVEARARAYLQAYGAQIDLWEIGNELNGAWVGASPAEINAKVQAAYDVVAGEYDRPTAITLNYWSTANCFAKPWEATLAFAQAMPAAVRAGTDYVMLSIYETACKPAQHPSAAAIGDMLAALGTLFPNARLGIGETGAQGTEDGLPRDATLAKKRRIAAYYYGLDHELRARLGDRFVGGYFWWYYAEDAVPRRHPGSLWPTLDPLLAALG